MSIILVAASASVGTFSSFIRLLLFLLLSFFSLSFLLVIPFVFSLIAILIANKKRATVQLLMPSSGCRCSRYVRVETPP